MLRLPTLVKLSTLLNLLVDIKEENKTEDSSMGDLNKKNLRRIKMKELNSHQLFVIFVFIVTVSCLI